MDSDAAMIRNGVADGRIHDKVRDGVVEKRSITERDAPSAEYRVTSFYALSHREL